MDRRLLLGGAGVLFLAGCVNNPPTPMPTNRTPVPTQDVDARPSATATATKGNPRPTATTRSPKPSATATTGTPILVDIRVGKQTGYDRITFEFEGKLPDYRVDFVEKAVEDGSGNVVHVPGRKLLEVRLAPCDAHRQDGSMTAGRARTLNYPSITAWRMTGDFEAVVHVVVGVIDDNPVKVRTLTNPNRLYIDVPHTDETDA